MEKPITYEHGKHRILKNGEWVLTKDNTALPLVCRYSMSYTQVDYVKTIDLEGTTNSVLLRK